MRRSLTISMLLVITIMVMTTISYAETNASWGTGLTLTEKEVSASLGSRIDAIYGDNVLGSWFSSSNILPQIVGGGPYYMAYGDFSGIKNVQKVEMSPDHGKTVWKAQLIPGKGYCVELPDMSPGSYALEWGVSSKDKRNRVVLLIIPINWSSHRETNSLNQIMVQSAPVGSGNYNETMWFSCLRGFVSSQATPDMGYLAQQQASGQMMKPQSQPEPIVQPRIEPKPRLKKEPKRVVQREEQQVQVQEVQEDNPCRVFVLNGNYLLTLIGMDESSFPIRVNGKVSEGAKVTFSRNGNVVASATVANATSGKIFAEVDSIAPGGIKPGDKIAMEVQ